VSLYNFSKFLAWCTSIAVILVELFVVAIAWLIGSSIESYVDAVQYVLLHDAEAYIKAIEQLTGSAEEAKQSIDRLDKYLNSLDNAAGPLTGTLGLNPVQYFIGISAIVMLLKALLLKAAFPNAT